MRRTAVLCLGTVLLLGSSGCSRRKKQSVLSPPAPVVPTAPRRSTPVPAVSQRPAQPKAEAPKPPAAVVEPLTTPAQRNTWAEQIASSLQKAEQNAAALQSRNLRGEPLRALGRVQSFIRQAREAERAHDYVTARTFAQRAQVLSEDLLKR